MSYLVTFFFYIINGVTVLFSLGLLNSIQSSQRGPSEKGNRHSWHCWTLTNKYLLYRAVQKAGVMRLQPRLHWSVCLLLLLLWPYGYHCMTVYFVTQQPVHVFPAGRLVLKVQISCGHTEQVARVTWEREPESVQNSWNLGKETLITFPDQAKRLDGRFSLEQQGTILKLEGFGRADSGVYTVTVTDQAGVNTSAQCVVKEYEAVHHPSVRVNVSHSSLFCVEAWGTDLQFSWFHEKAAITDAVGHVSPDGRTLFISSNPICGHFTCMVSNKLGQSSATYTAEPCERAGRGTRVAVVSLIILLVCGGLLAFLLWRRHRHYSKRGERLRNDLEDDL